MKLRTKSFYTWLKTDTNIAEMAYINDIVGGQEFNRTNEWNKIKDSEDSEDSEDSNFVHLLSKDINSSHDKIYQYGTKTFFLTSKDNDYKGHIELNSNDCITNSFADSSKIKGFYNIIFTQILANTSIKTIFSDTSLSDNAINSYEKLSQSNVPNFKVTLYINGEYEEFNKEKLLSQENIRVSISENWCKEHFKEFTHRINALTEGTPNDGFWKQKFLSHSKLIDDYMYGKLEV